MIGTISLRQAGTVLALLAMAACGHTRAEPPPPSAVAPTKPDHEQGAETGIPVASTPQGLLRDGAEKRLQLRLKERGLLTAAQCSGQLDPATRKALRAFQRSEGLPATGLPSYETVDHLGLDLDQVFQTVARPRDPG
jgi:peptidoglycan hydrolase-like protein with peptidoglycan-binding domain